MPLKSKDGTFLGKLQHIYFNQETGELEGLEVSGGLFADQESKRGFVPLLDRLELTPNAIIVSLETVRLIEEQEAQAATSESLLPSMKGLLGRRVRYAVQTNTGLYVAVTGQIVSERVLQLAKAHQKEEALLKAVSKNDDDSALANRNQETSQALVQELLEVVEEGISGLLMGVVNQLVPQDEPQPTFCA